MNNRKIRGNPRRSIVLRWALLPLGALAAGCTPIGGQIVSTETMPSPVVTQHDHPASARVAAVRAAQRTTTRLQIDDRNPEVPVIPVVADSSSHPLVQEKPEMNVAATTTETKSTPKTYGAVSHVDTAGFDSEVLQADAPVLVDFYADWCGPCRRLAPVLDQLARQRPEAKVVKVNVDRSPELAARYRVESIPTVIVFKQGSVAARQNGLVDAAALQRMLGG